MSIKTVFYVQSMFQVYLETIGIYAIWTIAMILLKSKAKRIVSIIGTIVTVIIIITFTVVGRRSGETQEIILMPLVSFEYAKLEPELYRTMYMNMLLFMPLGLSLPFAISNKVQHRILLSILVGALLSVAVEVCQFVFALGRCETDDVIMNTLGVLIGSTSFLVVRAITKFIELKKAKDA